MNTKKPIPVLIEPRGKICPICGRRSYSPAGIHPQCAVHQADAPRREYLRTHKGPKVIKVKQQRSWDKKCPKCSAQVHIRKNVCDCGHDFFGK